MTPVVLLALTATAGPAYGCISTESETLDPGARQEIVADRLDLVGRKIGEARHAERLERAAAHHALSRRGALLEPEASSTPEEGNG